MKDIKIVIGANFGDEGKGLMVDYFSQKPNSIVVCSNGGAQRGHTVTTPNGIRHIFWDTLRFPPFLPTSGVNGTWG